MASLLISDDTVTVDLSTAEKVEALHGDVTFPRSAVTAVRRVDHGLDEVHGLRMPGTGFPGLIRVGTFRGELTTFAVCHGNDPGVVIDLQGQPFDRLVLTLDDPDTALALRP